MSYDLHVTRGHTCVDADRLAITKQDLDLLIWADPDLSWSQSHWVDMRDEDGAVTRFYAILWRRKPSFWWYGNEITCANPNAKQQKRLIRMARSLCAIVVGDDGERYELRRNMLGFERIVLQTDL